MSNASFMLVNHDHSPGRRISKAATALRGAALAGILLLFLAGFRIESAWTLFENGDYSKAVAALDEHLASAPGDADARFLLGRCYLAMEQPDAALVQFQKAASVRHETAEFQFWLGVAHWALLDFEAEAACYRRALDMDPTHLPSRVYLGHNRMDHGLWQAAIDHYRQVLATVPDHADVLFNTAFALRKLGRREVENAAWQRYLKHVKTGAESYRAVDFLNANGDFSYRSAWIGQRRVILPGRGFQPDRNTPTTEFMDALVAAAASLDTLKKPVLHIVVHVDGDSHLARDRALAVKGQLLDRVPSIEDDRIQASWFGVPERIDRNGPPTQLAESIRIFTTTELPIPEK